MVEDGTGDCDVDVDDVDAAEAAASNVDEGAKPDVCEGAEFRNCEDPGISVEADVGVGTGSVAEPVPDLSSVHITRISDML